MKISYKGINEKVVTFLADGEIKPGDLVRVSENNTVKVCEAGEVFDGIAVSVAGGLCSVQVAGCAEIAAAEPIDTGYQSIVAENGGAIASINGRMCTVINCDADAHLATILF